MMRSNLSLELENKGYVVIHDQSSLDVKHIINDLGESIYVTDVKINPNSRALVTSSKSLDFHTDHHKARWILWHCLEQTDIGGESILVDARAAYSKLNTEDRRNLFYVRLFEHKIFEDDEDSHPVAVRDDSGIRFYYSFWLFNKEMPAWQKKALLAFRQAIAKEEPFVIKLKKSDVLVVDNHRILHGRREIGGNKRRFLKRFWIKQTL